VSISPNDDLLQYDAAATTLDTRVVEKEKKKMMQRSVHTVRERLRDILGDPYIELRANLRRNFEMLRAYVPDDYDFPRDWQKGVGAVTLAYFEGLAEVLVREGFDAGGGDDLLREGFAEVVWRGEVAVRVVEGLESGEVAVVDGVLELRTLPRWWAFDVGDCGRRL